MAREHAARHMLSKVRFLDPLSLVSKLVPSCTTSRCKIGLQKGANLHEQTLLTRTDAENAVDLT